MLGNALCSRSDLSQYDISPLPGVFRKGLVAIILIASLSAVTTFALLIFITYRLIFWRSHYSRYLGYNQYIILIYQLILADLQHALGCLISVKWLMEDKITADSWTCFGQGMWLQLANPGSGLFVLAIAVHTYLAVMLNRKLSYGAFVACVISIWTFMVAMVIIPMAIHGREAMVPSGAWCWINSKYEPLRLCTHYLWVFAAEFGSVCLYAIVAFRLRRTITNSAVLASRRTESLRRVVRCMVIYPIAYIILSLPIAAGRMAMVRGVTPSPAYFCAAATVITSSGFVDVAIYALTRRKLIMDTEPSYGHTRDRFGISTPRKQVHHLATVTAGANSSGGGMMMFSTRTGRGSSTENIVHDLSEESSGLAQAYRFTAVEVTSQHVYPSQAEASERSSKDSERNSPALPPATFRMWGW
ncbi:uncharacterized protein P174DRAFT_397440 [Aspergillus novofumigatus IBT 16806]|uniref:G protein-coupled receptor GPR1/2/3 C-terminal domain-containing protein n=1 Tax=Aspergillus novofumigatus (strain IBT 16806) TaxID=1392255 RepID=A0A2I1BUM4_ASPN1|nr:uncharacterized protein P174DRAFT_397440 [Aspergillus novofumigatus IBT 16806]PKX89097.1 hypothetical protein P174DRAFT_397440 [Aspergillus novofumigatus IBT 16806]